MSQRQLEALGRPDLQIGGLRIWVHGWEFPDLQDHWDGNWLRVTSICEYPDSMVTASGAILRTSEIEAFLRSVEELRATLSGCAVLDCIEPNLKACLSAKTLGHIEIEIEITPDQLNERHNFKDELDQSFLDPIILGCRTILERFPIRGTEGE